MDDDPLIDAALSAGDGAALNARGIALAEGGRLDDACRVFRAAASLGDTDALSNLGKALRHLGDAVGAAEAYRSAVAAGHSGDRVWLGVVLFDDLDRQGDGEELLRNAYVDREPDAAHQLALTMLATDRNDEAIELLRSLPPDETDGNVLDSFSSALRFAGRPADALDAADRAIAAGYGDALLNRAFALDDLDHPDTEAAHRDAIAAGVDDAAISYAAWLWRAERRDDAIAALRAAPQDDESVLIDLSSCLAGVDPESREPHALLRRAILLGSIDAMTNLAGLLEAAGEDDVADRLWRQAAAEGDDLAARLLDED